MSARTKPQAGFTLVELMVVLAILIALGAIAQTSFERNTAETAAAGLAREVYAMTNQARVSAQTRNRQVRLRLRSQNPAAEMQHALVQGNAVLTSGDWGPVEQRAEAKTNGVLTGVDGGVLPGSTPPGSAMAGTAELIFYPNGVVQLTGAGTTGATIYFADRRFQHPQRVLVYGRTGFARVMDQ